MKKRKQSTERITHLIQARMTVTPDVHVCSYCGDNAHILDVGYEATTQELADRFTEEIRSCTTMEEQWQKTVVSDISEIIYRKTVEEQRTVGPREHTRSYRCFSCMAMLLSKATGIEYSGETVLMRLSVSPLSSAVFVVRDVKEPDYVILMNAPFQDLSLLKQALRREQRIPRMELTHIRPKGESR